MKLEITNQNYNAVIVKINNLVELENCDNVLWFPIYWVQAIVSKNTEVWTVWILFGPETQLSDDFCKNNNLYRHSEKNLSTDVKWYIEDNRRVKAMKFRWHKSSALFMPLESLAYLNIPYNTFKEWDSFNTIDWIEVCKKYMIYVNEPRWNKVRWSEKRFEKIDNKTFPEHLDSDNYFRNVSHYKDEDTVIVTQKLHGTSGRFGNCLSRRPLKWYERILSKVVDINSHKYESHYGSRRVIKTWMVNKNNVDFYDNDVWNVINERVKSIIPQDWIIYWEIIWWDGNKPIQKWYTYSLQQWEVELYVYRISVVNQQGIVSDLSWDAIKQFCTNNGIKHVPELWVGKHKDFNVDDYMDKNYKEMWYNCVPLSEWCPCDEWVIVRKEWVMPYLSKAKCNTFLEYESKQLDSWEVDLESSQV